MAAENPKRSSGRRWLWLVAVIPLVVAGVFVSKVRDSRQRARQQERALKLQLKEMERLKREHLERLDRRRRRLEDGVWMCDELPCNQGDLRPTPKRRDLLEDPGRERDPANSYKRKKADP